MLKYLLYFCYCLARALHTEIRPTGRTFGDDSAEASTENFFMKLNDFTDLMADPALCCCLSWHLQRQNRLETLCRKSIIPEKKEEQKHSCMRRVGSQDLAL